MMKMNCAECGKEMKSANKPHDFRVHIIQKIAENAYQSEVIEPQMEENLIGPGEEYADKEDWITCWIYEQTEDEDF
jgi:hypothetical protein